MFLLDDLLLAPGKGAFVLFQELARKAQDEWLNDDTIKHELQQLNEMLEGGNISERDFEAKECRLLERLEQIARIKFQDKWGAESTVVEAGAEPVVEAAALPPAAPAALPPAPSPPREPAVPVAPVLVEPPPVFQAPAPPFVAPPAVAAPPPQVQVMPPMPSPMPPPIAQPPMSAPPPLMAQPPPMPAPGWPSPPPVPSPVWSSPPAPPPAMHAPLPAPGPVLTMGQIIDCAVRALTIMKMRVSSITAVVPEESGWRVSIELVERRGVPDTSDVLGLYEVRVDAAGNVLRYERTQMRRRCDFTR